MRVHTELDNMIDGVMIAYVIPGSAADLAGLRGGGGRGALRGGPAGRGGGGRKALALRGDVTLDNVALPCVPIIMRAPTMRVEIPQLV